MAPRAGAAGGGVLCAVVLLGCARASPGIDGGESSSSTGGSPVEAAPADGNAPAASARRPVDPGADARSGSAPGEAGRAPPSELLDATPRRVRAIGHTSVVLRVELASGALAVFKPASKRGPRRYKGEIAAFRLATAIGLEAHVPAAYAHSLRFEDLARALGDRPAARALEAELVPTGGSVRGALLPWIEGLEPFPLEAEPWWSRWRRWLGEAEARPDEASDVARATSALVVFDFLTGNWDRWSGGNISRSRQGDVLFVDNDGAFFEAPPASALARNRRLLEGVSRFSRALVDRVRQLDEGSLEDVFGLEAPNEPLLSKASVAGVARRRGELLRVVDAKVAALGEARVLAFP